MLEVQSIASVLFISRDHFPEFNIIWQDSMDPTGDINLVFVADWKVFSETTSREVTILLLNCLRKFWNFRSAVSFD